MDFINSRPIYQQIIEHIKTMLLQGKLKPGDKIPSQRELAEELRVNPNTIQRAYREMENMGLTETLRGQGTFVVQKEGLIKELHEEIAGGLLNEFLQQIKALGYEDKEIISLVKTGLEGLRGETKND